MCGIVGYIGLRQSVPLLLDGLKRLEYRGYDSAGICIRQRGQLHVVKQKGKIAELEEQIPTTLSGSIGIGHTRWATHGEPTSRNAHPHVSESIAIVHNGIIENHHALRKMLQGQGYSFSSDTDSEILAHLIHKFYDGDLESAVAAALQVVEGAYGLAVIHEGEDRIVAARKGSPLVLGVGDSEMLLASDAMALVHETKRVVYLNDDELAVLTPSGYTVKDFSGTDLKRKAEQVKMSIETIGKGGYKHFMLKEIMEQPCVFRDCIAGRIIDGKIKLSVDLDVHSLKHITILGCGTSWHAGLIAKSFFEKLCGIPTDVDYASEFRYRDPLVVKGEAVIAISQSGETADTLAALREAKKKHATTVGIVNVVGSTIAREVDTGMFLRAGPEIGVASTKAFTCQIISLLLLALHLRQQQGKTVEKELLAALQSLPDVADDTLRVCQLVEPIAGLYTSTPNSLYLGRGMHFPVALEGALKLKEISYIHAEGYPAAEMKHGPIALIDTGMPIVVLCPRDSVFDKVLSNMEEVRSRGAHVIAVTDGDYPEVNRLAEHTIVVPKTHQLLAPLLFVLPLQLLAYHIADQKGLDVDQPRNLAKSVTVE